jgi:hypothetical protein
MRFDGTQSQPEKSEKAEGLFDPAGSAISDLLAHCLVTKRTEMSRLPYKDIILFHVG